MCHIRVLSPFDAGVGPLVAPLATNSGSIFGGSLTQVFAVPNELFTCEIQCHGLKRVSNLQKALRAVTRHGFLSAWVLVPFESAYICLPSNLCSFLSSHTLPSQGSSLRSNNYEYIQDSLPSWVNIST